MAFNRHERRTRAKEERKLFPVWTLIVLVFCAAVWIYGVKLYQDQMAAYRAYAAICQTVGQQTFFLGITVDGMDLGGMTQTEARERLAQVQRQTEEAVSLVIENGDKRWRMTSKEVPMTFTTDQVLEYAYRIGRTGSLEKRYHEIQDAKDGKYRLATEYTYDRKAVDDLVSIIEKSLYVPAEDASLKAFDVQNKSFSFENEKNGYRIDSERLKNDILTALDEKAYDKTIAVHGETIYPEVTIEALKGRFGRISTYTTATTKDKDRNTNIALSANALNGKAVQPGETLSFNQCTGQRTGEKGYREAGAIAGGVLVDDTGGGVCQTSSTLFNAVVRADLKIVERYAHSWPSSYVNKGEDATVNWPSLDFVFKNEGKYPVFVVAWYADQSVTVEIYGEMLENGMKIELESTTVKTIKPSDEVLYTLDETLPQGTRKAGRKKRTGYVVDTYKVYYDQAGNEIERKKMWTTTYRATQDEILYH